MSAIEQRCTTILKNFLTNKGFICAEELQLSSKILDLESMVGQKQIRIDLAAISPIDQKITFVEAESTLYVEHPQMYRNFCDYLYLLVPDEAIHSQSSQEFNEQLLWAKNHGIGVISTSLPDQIDLLSASRICDSLDDTTRSVIKSAFRKRMDES